MDKGSKNECRCEKAACGCATGVAQSCTCGNSCKCTRTCACGGGCGCATK
jgi:hypothetical protein